MPTATEATNLVSKAANSNEPARPRLAAVDGLRPLLTMWVIIFHLGVPKESHSFAGHLLDMLARRGWIAVDCFFCMSGFFERYTQREGGQSPRRKLLALVLRCAPAYYASMLLALLVVPHSAYTALQVALYTLGLQTWLPIILTSDHPPHKEVYLPFSVNAPAWFVASLVWVVLLHALVASQERLSPYLAPTRVIPCLFAILICSFLRVLPSYLWTFGLVPHTFGASSSLGLVPSASIPLFGTDGSWARLTLFCSSKVPPGIFYVWPLSNILSYWAGGYAAQLTSLLMGRGLMASRMWQFVDAGCLLVFLLTIALPGAQLLFPDSPHSTSGHTALICLFLIATTAEKSGLIVRALSHPVLVALSPATLAAYLFAWPINNMTAQVTERSILFLPTYFILLWALAVFWAECVEGPWVKLVLPRVMSSLPPGGGNA